MRRSLALLALIVLTPLPARATLAPGAVELEIAGGWPLDPVEARDRWGVGPALGLRVGGGSLSVAHPHLQLGFALMPLDNGSSEGALKLWTLDAGLKLVPPDWRLLGLRPHLSMDLGIARSSIGETHTIPLGAPDTLPTDGNIDLGDGSDWGVTLGAGAGLTLLSAPGGAIGLEARYRMARLHDISTHFVQIGLSFALGGTP